MTDHNRLEPHPPGTGQAAEPLDWGQWYSETLGGLVAAVAAAAISWGTDPDGEPYIIPGQQRPAGVEYPLAMVLEFRKVRQGGPSDREDELHEITANVTVFDRDDPREYADNLRKTQTQMGAVETACYADRDLDGTCENLWVDEATAFELETDRGDETAGSIDLTIQKTATHAY